MLTPEVENTTTTTPNKKNLFDRFKKAPCTKRFPLRWWIACTLVWKDASRQGTNISSSFSPTTRRQCIPLNETPKNETASSHLNFIYRLHILYPIPEAIHVMKFTCATLAFFIYLFFPEDTVYYSIRATVEEYIPLSFVKHSYFFLERIWSIVRRRTHLRSLPFEYTLNLNVL